MVPIIKRLLILSLALLTGGSHAQGVLLKSDGTPLLLGGGIVSSVVASADPYDLGTLPSNVSDIQWPTEPTTSATVEVTEDADWTDADDTLYNVAAGTYTAKTVTCDNCEFSLADDAIVNGQLTITGSIVKWTGGQRTGSGDLDYTGSGDLLIDNFYVLTTGSSSITNNFTPSSAPWNRIAIINSTLEHTGGAVSGYVMFTQDGFGLQGNDLIIANVLANSNGQTWRLQELDDVVIVDSYFGSDNNTNNIFRSDPIDDLYMRDTILVGGSSCGETNDGVIEDLTVYAVDFWFSSGITCGGTGTTVNSTQIYDTSGAGETIGLGNATGTNPTTLAWDGTTVPSDASYGADH